MQWLCDSRRFVWCSGCVAIEGLRGAVVVWQATRRVSPVRIPATPRFFALYERKEDEGEEKASCDTLAALTRIVAALVPLPHCAGWIDIPHNGLG